MLQPALLVFLPTGCFVPAAAIDKTRTAQMKSRFNAPQRVSGPPIRAEQLEQGLDQAVAQAAELRNWEQELANVRVAEIDSEDDVVVDGRAQPPKSPPLQLKFKRVVQRGTGERGSSPSAGEHNIDAVLDRVRVLEDQLAAAIELHEHREGSVRWAADVHTGNHSQESRQRQSSIASRRDSVATNSTPKAVDIDNIGEDLEMGFSKQASDPMEERYNKMVSAPTPKKVDNLMARFGGEEYGSPSRDEVRESQILFLDMHILHLTYKLFCVADLPAVPGAACLA